MDSGTAAIRVLEQAVANGLVRGAVLHWCQGTHSATHAFGTATPDSAFLLGSITKPVVVAALLTLWAEGRFGLDEPVQRYLPAFFGAGRERVLIRHLLTHTSGLPDQLPENNALRQSHASLAAFVEGTCQVPLAFAPGTDYAYSSMGILLAAAIGQRLTGVSIAELVATRVLPPLGMTRSALGPIDRSLPCQVEHAAPEAGGGLPGTELWDWNSPYWRGLGAPWGGLQAAAADVARFLGAFLHPVGALFSPKQAAQIVANHNPAPLPPRGLGFELAVAGNGPTTFGHLGSTGTLAWADPDRDLTCVVLTTLPLQAVTPHPVRLVAEALSAAYSAGAARSPS